MGACNREETFGVNESRGAMSHKVEMGSKFEISGIRDIKERDGFNEMQHSPAWGL